LKGIAHNRRAILIVSFGHHPGGRVIHAPGKQVLVVGRTLVKNPADLRAARALQQQIKVSPVPK
jgi:hypothetical protein